MTQAAGPSKEENISPIKTGKRLRRTRELMDDDDEDEEVKKPVKNNLEKDIQEEVKTAI